MKTEKVENKARVKKEYYHKEYKNILRYVGNCKLPVMLVGPAGSGKNVCIEQVANALGLEMYYTNNVTNEYKITGFEDANGKYHETEFYKAFTKGGVFFLDEIDASDPSALIILNSALSNGYFTFPSGKEYMHPEFRCVAAANTWGNGGDYLFVGRNTLDSASLDRFIMVEFNYDKELERKLFPNEAVLKFVWTARESVQRHQIRHIFSTRTIKYFNCLLNEGIDLKTIVDCVLCKGMCKDDKVLVINDLKEMSKKFK